MKEAIYWSNEGDKVRCNLCNHSCAIAPGKFGICGVRSNEKGKLMTHVYGRPSSMTPDPIEKKPLFHFHPGTRAFSLGTVGCNFSCLHCQNHSISCAGADSIRLSKFDKDSVVKLAKKTGCQGVAWTYNEPTVWYEYTLDASKLVKKAGLYTCYVSNGYIQEAPLRELAPHLDAMNIDVKAFTEDFYKRIVKARLQPVLDTCILAKELGIHVELTYLIIPGENDGAEEILEFSKWVLENIGPGTAVHFSRFYPHHRMSDKPPTPVETLFSAHRIASEVGLEYVYLGNIAHVREENTYCPGCGEILIERLGFRVRTNTISEGLCPKCGKELPFVLSVR